MNTKNLRLGNFIKTKLCTNNIQKITGIFEFSINTIDAENIDIFSFEPIPLTKEWLERFGFETTAWDCNTTHRLMIGKNDYCIVISSNGFCEVGDAIVMNMDYVHQIQNLYFGLTGNELQCVGF